MATNHRLPEPVLCGGLGAALTLTAAWRKVWAAEASLDVRRYGALLAKTGDKRIELGSGDLSLAGAA